MIEYKVEDIKEFSQNALEDYLNKKIKQKWKLISVIPIKNNYIYNYRIIWSVEDGSD